MMPTRESTVVSYGVLEVEASRAMDKFLQNTELKRQAFDAKRYHVRGTHSWTHSWTQSVIRHTTSITAYVRSAMYRYKRTKRTKNHRASLPLLSLTALSFTVEALFVVWSTAEVRNHNEMIPCSGQKLLLTN